MTEAKAMRTTVELAPPRDTATVLLVDDDLSIVDGVTDFLQEEGFKVVSATNGAEALSLLRGGVAPDVILLDVMMPLMDGWDFRATQLADPALRKIPIVVMSACGSRRRFASSSMRTTSSPSRLSSAISCRRSGLYAVSRDSRAVGDFPELRDSRIPDRRIQLPPIDLALAGGRARTTKGIAHWPLARMRGTIDPEEATVVEIIDGFHLLDELVEILRQKDGAHARGESDRANELVIGSQRFHAGFSLGAVVREYGVLRECLLELRDRHLPVDIGELQVIMDALNAAVANATEQFVRERDRAIKDQNQKHFGFIAHELRNPLSSALLAAHALHRRPGADADIVVMRLVRNLVTLRDLVDNTLTSVRIQDLARNGRY